MTQPVVSAIIVSYGTRDLTLAALESVRARESETPLEAIVVDNASPDDSADAVARSAPWVTLVRSPVNGGFARGANTGASVARGDWLLFLNSDARIVPGTLPALLAEATRLERPGALGPRLMGPAGPEHSVGRYYGPWRDFVRAFRLYRLFPRSPRFEDLHVRRLPQVTSPVEWISGACFLIRRDVFAEMNGFDEAYFMYVEDMDLCYRLTQAGRTNLYVPAAVAYHDQGKSPRPDRAVFIEGGDAAEYFVKKTGMRYPLVLQRFLRAWLLATYMGTLLGRILMLKLRGRSTDAARGLLRSSRESLQAVFRSGPAGPRGGASLRSES